MGACGCGDLEGNFKIKGPGETWYIVQVYFGCDYCDTPAGVIIHRFDKQNCKLWDVDSIPELPFVLYNESDAVNGEICIPIIHGEFLKLSEEIEEGYDNGDKIGIIKSAAHKTFEKYFRERLEEVVPTGKNKHKLNPVCTAEEATTPNMNMFLELIECEIDCIQSGNTMNGVEKAAALSALSNLKERLNGKPYPVVGIE